VDDIREEMVNRGVGQLAARGLTVGLEGVDFGEAALASHVDIPQAHEAWAEPGIEKGPEQRFREAVAIRVLQKQPTLDGQEMDGGGLTPTLIAVTALLESMPNLDDASAEVRGYWLRQITRTGAQQNESSIENSQLLKSYVAISAALASLPEIPTDLSVAQAQGDAYVAQRYRNLYLRVAELFGYQLRYCYSWEQFTTAVVAFARGLIIRANQTPETQGIERFTGPDNEAQEWTLFAVGLEALVRQFFEPVPGEQPTSLEHELEQKQGAVSDVSDGDDQR